MGILNKIKNNENGVLDNPSLLSEYLVTLCASIVEAENAKVQAEIKYAQKWKTIRMGLESDKRADMECKLEPEYIDLRATEAFCRSNLEVIRAIKKRLSFLTIDYHENLSNPNVR